MSIFEDYARYYDLFYTEKDYAAEAKFVLDLVKEEGLQPGRILDLGCGTGRHAIEWARLGLEVHGVEQSVKMAEQARERIPYQLADRIQISVADLRQFDTPSESFDLVTAMFAVLGYFIDQGSLFDVFELIHKALRPGGLFICDTWHGAAVMKDGPSDRMQVYDRPEGKLYRFVQSRLDSIRQVVEVHYTLVEVGTSTVVSEETHRMRFFMAEEMKLFAKLNGLNLLRFHPFMRKDSPLEMSDWNVSWVFGKS